MHNDSQDSDLSLQSDRSLLTDHASEVANSNDLISFSTHEPVESHSKSVTHHLDYIMDAENEPTVHNDQTTSYVTVESQQNNVEKSENMRKMSAEISKVNNYTEQEIVRSSQNQSGNVHKVVNTYEQSPYEASTEDTSDLVVLRPKTKQSARISSKADNVQPVPRPNASYINNKRPVSMIDVSHTSTASSRLNDIRKSFANDSKPLPPLRKLSALRPLSASTSDLSRLSSVETGRPVSERFSSSTFLSRTSVTDYPKKRQKDGSPFQVDVLKGIAGIGLKIKVTAEGHTRITEIQSGGPVDKNGHVRVNDYLLFVNSTPLTGQSDARVQQIMRLLPRGLTKLVICSTAPASVPQLQLQKSNSSNLQHLQHQPIKSQRIPPASANRSHSISALENETDILQVKDVSQLQQLASSESNTIETAVVNIDTQNTGMVKVTTTNQPETLHQTSQAHKSENYKEHPQSKPQNGYESSLDEVFEEYYEHALSKELQDVSDPEIMVVTRTVETDLSSAPKQYNDQEVSSSSDHYQNIQNNKDLLESTGKDKSNSAEKLLIDMPLNANSVPTIDNISSQATSKLSSPELLPSSHDGNKIKSKTGSSSISETTESDINNKKFTNLTSDQIVPTSETLRHLPLSSSSIKKEDNVDGVEHNHTKPQPKRSTGYERLQSITKESENSKIIDKPGTFVSSTAKLFDLKATSNKASTDHPVPTKRTSININTNSNSNNVQNKSLKSIQGRWKSTETDFPLNSLTQSGSLPSSSRPKSVSSTGFISQRISTLESSRRYSGSVDNLSKMDVGSTHLNYALSPRRTTFDFTATPSLVFPTKHTVKNQSPEKFISSKNTNLQKSDIYRVGHSDLHQTGHSKINKSTSVILPDKNSLSQDRKSSSAHGKHSYTKAHEEFRSSSSPITLSFITESREDMVKDTISKFDELLTDSHFQQRTDQQDLLLLLPVSNDSSLSKSQILSLDNTSSSQSEVFEIERAVTSPRRVLQNKAWEMENEFPSIQNMKQTNEVNEKIIELNDADTLKIPEKKEDSLIGVSQYVNTLTIDDLLFAEGIVENTAPANISKHLEEKIYDDESTVTNKTINEAKQDSKEQNRNNDKLLNSSVIHNASENHKQPLQDLQVELNQTEDVIIKKDNNIPIQKSRNEDMIDSSSFDSANSTLNNEVNSDFKPEWEENDAPKDLYCNQDSQLLENVKMEIKSNPSILQQDNMSTLSFEPVFTALSDDEEPPPLPGAPPPPLILRDVNQLLDRQDLEDQIESSVGPVNIIENITEKRNDNDSYTVINQSTISGVIHLEVNTQEGVLVVPDQSVAASEQQVYKVYSAEPLKSTEDSFHERDYSQVYSPSPVDMLSEDSGMPADDDQEVATDDAISPPGELSENVIASDLMKNMILPSDIEAGLLSSKTEIGLLSSETEIGQSSPLCATVQETETTILDATPSHREDVFTYTDVDTSKIDIAIDDLAPPFLPSSLPPNVTSLEASEIYNEDFIFQQTSAISEPSHFQSFSTEIDLLENDIPFIETKMLIPMSSVSTANSETGSEVKKKSANNPDTKTASGDLVYKADNIVQEPVVLQPQDNILATVTSKRKWSLRSNKCKSPVLVGKCGVPVETGNIDDIFAKVLQHSDLVNLIDKANAVLDAIASINLHLMIVHLHRDGDGIPLGVDLKHEGGNWFKVSGIKKGSPVWEEGGAKVGDWLVAVDSLWCDHVNVMRFLSRMSMPKHDSLLVFARQETSVEDIVSPVQETILTSTQEAPQAKKRLHKPSEQKQQLFSENVQASSVNAAEPSAVFATLSDQSQTFSEHVPSLLNQQQLPKQTQVPLLPKQKSQENVPLLNNQASSYTRPASLSMEEQQPFLHQIQLMQDATPDINTAQLENQKIVSASLMELSSSAQNKPTTSLRNEQIKSSLVSNENVSVIKPNVFNGEQERAKNKTVNESHEYLKNVQVSSLQAPDKKSSVNVTKLQEHVQVENIASSPTGSPTLLGPGVHKVVITKGATGVGFCLEGGVGSPKGDLPITIKRIFKGGPAEKCGLLKVNDEVLEVNGLKFSTMRHYEAWNHLKFLKDGEVHITIQRN